MNKQAVKQLIASLCADELVELKKDLDNSIVDFISAKDSNHKVIQREHHIHCCPFCGSLHVVKNGVRKDTNRQKYLCKDCKKSHSDTTGTIAYHSRKSYNTWEQYISCLLKSMTLSDTACCVGISITTAFAWRHKLLKTLSTFNKSTELKEIIELDSIYFSVNLKGTKRNKMPRYSKKRTSSAYRGISHHKVCVVTAIDSNDNILIETSGTGVETTAMYIHHQNRFETGSILVTDSKRCFDRFAMEKQMIHHYIPSGFYKSDSGYTLATINGMHSELKTWLKRFRGVSTKHLQGYLDLFRYMKHLKYKVEYDDRVNKTYCYAIPSNTSITVDQIYNESMPIDLRAVYEEYHYGIFSNLHQSLS